MIKNTYLITVWFLAGWMLGAMVAFVLGLSGAFAPLVAVAAAGIVLQRHRANLRAPSVPSTATTADRVA